MSGWLRSRYWLLICCSFVPSACQDRPLNLLPGSAGAMAAAGSVEATAGASDAAEASAGVSGLPFDPGGNSAGFQGGGAGTTNVGGSFGGGSSGQSSTAGTAGRSASGGTSGTNNCVSDADCAPPTPGCSPTAHVCQQCSKNSQCPNGQLCSVDDGECGN